MEKNIQLDIQEIGENVLLQLNSGTLCGPDEIREYSDRIKTYIQQHQPQTLVIDFDRVKFFSSQVLGMLLEVRSMMQKHDGQMLISSINPQLYRVFKITNLDKIFKFCPDRREAIKMMRS